jgi:hypothetical protein
LPEDTVPTDEVVLLATALVSGTAAGVEALFTLPVAAIDIRLSLSLLLV